MTNNDKNNGGGGIALALAVIIFIYITPSRMIWYFTGMQDANNFTYWNFFRDIILSTVFWVVYFKVIIRIPVWNIVTIVLILVAAGYMIFNPDPIATKYCKQQSAWKEDYDRWSKADTNYRRDSSRYSNPGEIPNFSDYMPDKSGYYSNKNGYKPYNNSR